MQDDIMENIYFSKLLKALVLAFMVLHIDITIPHNICHLQDDNPRKIFFKPIHFDKMENKFLRKFHVFVRKVLHSAITSSIIFVTYTMTTPGRCFSSHI